MKTITLSIVMLCCVLIVWALLFVSGNAAPKPDNPQAAGSRLTPEEGKRLMEGNAKKMREPWRKKNFEEFKAKTYREPFEGGKYIVNGDTPILNEKSLRKFFETQIQMEPTPIRAELVVNQENGKDTAWNSIKKRQLTYCISKAFGPQHTKVVADMESAGSEWSKAADVKFIHVVAMDENCKEDTQGVVFDVRPVNVNGKYLARAFFPNEPRPSRNVLIDQSALQLSPGEKLTLAGILRHELGHTLGFRHEHTRPEAGACFEDSNFRPLTNYDQFSVMHYPQCNGRGDWSLQLTERDKQGAVRLYGLAK